MDVPLREMGAGATSTPAAAAAAVQPRWFAWARRRTVRTALLGWWLLCTALGAASIMPYVGLVGWDSQNQLPDTLRGKLALGWWYSYFPRQARGALLAGAIPSSRVCLCRSRPQTTRPPSRASPTSS